MCAAGGKIILTLALHTILYPHPKFHEIIFHIDKTTVFWISLHPFPPKSPLEGEDVNFRLCPRHLSMTVDVYNLFRKTVFKFLSRCKFCWWIEKSFALPLQFYKGDHLSYAIQKVFLSKPSQFFTFDLDRGESTRIFSVLEGRWYGGIKYGRQGKNIIIFLTVKF